MLVEFNTTKGYYTHIFKSSPSYAEMIALLSKNNITENELISFNRVM
jgi:hypothetical protein